ncbi:MAG: glycogen synthase GlgA [Clostridia bacterium]|nr:glycogen synthase GlgA [Clostridia bacterium]
MNSILFAGSEIMPFAATGGLGDVLGALPAALKKSDRSLDVRCVMPLYSKISDEWRSKMTFERWIMVNVSWRRQYCGIFSLVKDGVKYYFIDNEQYFSRGQLYGEFDDAERFAFFSYAVLDLMAAVDFYPDVLHANDWQTALSVIVLKQLYSGSPEYARIRAVYTIHNIEYQGVYGMEIFGDVFGFNDYMRGIVNYSGTINLTKGAIVCADRVTTVSPQYAKEIQTEEFSWGLHHILRQYSFKIDGIINGIDVDFYNPSVDTDIPYQFNLRSLRGKAEDKAELQRRFGLPVRSDVPIYAMISRLAAHKGFDLVKRILDEFLADDVQFILLGTGEHEYEEFFRGVAARHPDKASVSISYDRKLSKLIYAGADIFLMPSRSEACGLAQMIASRYGTVPVVRETGGLYDTIKPYCGEDYGNGFTFAAYNAHDMMHVMRDAEAMFGDKQAWTKLVKKIMKIDFSWRTSAEKYRELYETVSKY